MKFISISVTSNKSVPDAAALWYSIVRQACPVLPPADRLLRAVARPTQFFAWLNEQEPDPGWAMSCYYLELLSDQESEEGNEFLIRLEKAMPDGNAMPVRVSVIGTEQALLSVELAFSHRGNMVIAGRAVRDLQEELTKRRIAWDLVRIMIEGIRSESKTMKETMLAAFRWDGKEMVHRADERWR